MSMRLWLPAALCLTLVALGAVYATTSRHASTAERAAPAEPAPSGDSPADDVASGQARQRFLPNVPSAPVAAPAEPQAPVTNEVAAAPAPPASPEASARDRELERMRASGPDGAGLGEKVQSMQGDWQALAVKAGIDVQVSPLECYQAGCFATLVFKGRDSVERLTSEIFDSKAVAEWPGPKTRSAPLARPDGGAEVTWLLLPPERSPGTVAN